MTFIWPQALYLLAFVPIYIYLHFYFEKRKKKDIVPFGNLEILIEAITNTKKIDLLKYFPLILKTLLLCTLIFALGRPQSKVYIPTKDTKIMLLIDTSISMEATDIEPDRITAAKEAAKQFIKNLPDGIQIGIGFFSGNVKVLVNPTLEKLQVLEVLKKLNKKALEPGTAIGDAILAGLEAITYEENPKVKFKNNRMLVLVTDGETNIGHDPIFAAAQAKINNITIQAVGIGNPLGTIIRGGILTRLDEFTLREITELTGGYYFNAQNLSEMKKIYKKIKKTIKLVPKETEVTFIPLITAFFLLVIYQLLKWSKFRLA